MQLQCCNITKTYGSVVALKDVNLEVEKGEIRALLGGNGSGKSTLAKILGGSVRMDTGTVKWEGKPYSIKSPHDAKEHHIIVTSQELSLLSNLSIGENLCLSCLPVKMKFLVDQERIRADVSEVLKLVGLSGLIDRKVGGLPANHQYLIEFAKALIQKPELLIVDEITSALFRDEVERVKQILHMLKKQGCTIIFISHRMQEIESICDTVTIMRNGETIKTLPVHGTDPNELLSLMTGKKISEWSVGVKKDIEEPEASESASRIMLEVKAMNLHGFHQPITMQVRAGEIIGIAGLQGQGQSDLVRQLFGLYGPVHMTINGKEKDIQSCRQAVQNGIAFLSGNRISEGIFEEQSVSENLRAVSNAMLHRPELVNERQIFEKYSVVLGSPKQKITSLSGGNQQKIVIGRWTSINPCLLLADDPTKGVDIQARRDVREIMYELARKETAVLMVSSDNEELVELARNAEKSRVFIMYEGQIVSILSGAEITEANIAAASLQMGKKESV